MASEVQNVIDRYARRAARGDDLQAASLIPPHRLPAHQEKERAMIGILRRFGSERLGQLRALEVGCGFGHNLLRMLSWGFTPENLVGNELLAERCEIARHMLPSTVTILEGDASELPLAPRSFDVVLASTVFTSILDDDFQRRLADRIWSLVAPGGGVLWYDFIYSNPRNPDVRGVSRARIRRLFPEAAIELRSVTLAPPIARRVARIHPALYAWFNLLPLLRSHVVGWFEKSLTSARCDAEGSGTSARRTDRE